MKLFTTIVVALALTACAEPVNIVGPKAMSNPTQDSKPQLKNEVVTPSILDDMDEEVTILEMVCSFVGQDELYTDGVLAFRFPTAAVEASEILNDFLKENDIFLDVERTDSIDLMGAIEIIHEKMEEMDFPVDRVGVGTQGCKFRTYTLPLRD